MSVLFGNYNLTAEVPFEAYLMEVDDVSICQQVAEKAQLLSQSGYSQAKIARTIGIDDKIIEKALRWLEKGRRPEDIND